jgi:hypothetical protein
MLYKNEKPTDQKPMGSRQWVLMSSRRLGISIDDNAAVDIVRNAMHRLDPSESNPAREAFLGADRKTGWHELTEASEEAQKLAV